MEENDRLAVAAGGARARPRARAAGDAAGLTRRAHPVTHHGPRPVGSLARRAATIRDLPRARADG